MGAQKTEDIKVTVSCGNVFRDMGFPDADERLTKADLAIRINDILEQRKLTKAKVIKILEIDKKQLFDLMNGRLSAFSIDTLIHYLNCLNQDVEIVVKSRRGRPTHGKLKATIN